MSGDIIIHSSSLKDAEDILIAKTIGDHLEKHYPNYAWCVNCDHDTGMIQFWSMRLSGEYGMRLKIYEYLEDVDLKLITRMGGELLERFRVKIGHADEAQLDDKRVVAGRFAFDYHEMKDTKKVSDTLKMRWDYFK